MHGCGRHPAPGPAAVSCSVARPTSEPLTEHSYLSVNVVWLDGELPSSHGRMVAHGPSVPMVHAADRGPSAWLWRSASSRFASAGRSPGGLQVRPVPSGGRGVGGGAGCPGSRGTGPPAPGRGGTAPVRTSGAAARGNDTREPAMVGAQAGGGAGRHDEKHALAVPWLERPAYRCPHLCGPPGEDLGDMRMRSGGGAGQADGRVRQAAAGPAQCRRERRHGWPAGPPDLARLRQ